MKNLFLMLLIIIDIIQLCQTTFAAKILLKDGNQFPPGEIIGIQEQTVVVKTEFGNLTADFSKIDTILFDETADPLKPGVQFTNGDMIIGELDTLKDNVLTIKMKYGMYIVYDINAIKSVNFINNSDPFEYSQSKELNALFYLNKYEQVYGQLLTIEDNVMVVNSTYGTLKIRINDTERIQFTDAMEISDVKTPTVFLKNNDKIQGKPTSFKDSKFHIETEFGEVILINQNALAIIVLEENQKMAKTISSALFTKNKGADSNFSKTVYNRSTNSIGVYSQPNLQSSLVRKLVQGEPVTAFLEQEGWYKIRTASGLIGWVRKDWVHE